ncbi:preprotein translocase subunit SecG [Geopsychrobacter electrodiphilus]|uniref:preprotein translocase subunit SecG n=1 Tax=Geopsychrobacter electrodiphilus TaxID=225196 RepID=UPI00037B16E1|nr:preprotein translocase subunit SecG [Geopsychrobacter electrodiphilus]
MTYLLIGLHVVVCFALIIIVLLQMGKGAEVGASFGAGGSQTIFGAAGGASFMGKVTAGAAVIFMLTSLALAYFYGSPASKTIMPASVNTPAAPADGGFAGKTATPAEPAAPVTAPAEKKK